MIFSCMTMQCYLPEMDASPRPEGESLDTLPMMGVIFFCPFCFLSCCLSIPLSFCLLLFLALSVSLFFFCFMSLIYALCG